jgi:hypothetical protein
MKNSAARLANGSNMVYTTSPIKGKVSLEEK